MDGSRKKDSVEEEIDGEEKQVRSGNNHCIGQNGQDEGKEQRKDKSKTIVAKLHEKLSFAQSQLQAISQLIAGVNKKAGINAKHWKWRRKMESLCCNIEKKKLKKLENMKRKWQ